MYLNIIWFIYFHFKLIWNQIYQNSPKILHIQKFCKIWTWPFFQLFQSIFDDTLWIWSIIMRTNFVNDFGHPIFSLSKLRVNYRSQKIPKHADPLETKIYAIHYSSAEWRNILLTEVLRSSVGKPSTWFPTGRPLWVGCFSLNSSEAFNLTFWMIFQQF